tara:strand:- start:314 stop:1654 length:1341 start_codon:yes stop_codon:yes gene_type:complete
MPYAPQFSGSSIIFVSSSFYTHVTSYTSSNPDLVASGSASGTFTGPELHLQYMDWSVSGSSSILGVWSGSQKYYTESGANSHNIPVGSASIFTQSGPDFYFTGSGTGSSQYAPSIIPSQEETSSIQGMKIELEDDGSLRIWSTQSEGAATDTTGLYISASGKIGIGTTDPQEALDLGSLTANLGPGTKIPGLERSISGSINSLDSAMVLRAPINNPTFTGTIGGTNLSVASMTGSLKGNINGSSTNVAGSGITISSAGIISSSISSGTHTLGTDLLVYGRITSRGSDISLETGSIEVSGDVIGGADGTGSFSHIITDGETIEFRNKGTGAREGYVKFDTTNGLQPLDSSKAAMKLKAATVESTVVTGCQFTASCGVSASAVSSSGWVQGEHIYSSDDVQAADDVIAGGDVSANGDVVFNGCTMTYSRTANTVTFTAGGRSVTLSLR